MDNNLTPVDLIRAVLDGKTAQCRDSRGNWLDYAGTQLEVIAGLATDLHSYKTTEGFRIKPEPVVRWVMTYKGAATGSLYISQSYEKLTNLQSAQRARIHNCKDGKSIIYRVELDPDTMKILKWEEEQV